MGTANVMHWEGTEVPGESGLRSRMEAEGLRPYRWSNGPGDVYAVHEHSYNKVIYVVQGTITFGLPDLERQMELRAGDRLELSAGVRHDAVVGPQGVVCLEAHR